MIIDADTASDDAVALPMAIDWVAPTANATVVTEVDEQRFKAMLFAACRRRAR